jgi:type IV fimbrial biogenesis protein FimT
MRHKNSGFTFLEMMTVIGIMGIIATIAIPHILGWLPRYRLGSAARDILSAMQYARLVAVKENVDVHVNFSPDDNNFLIFADYNSDNHQNSDEPTIRKGKMPGGVTLEDASFSFGYDWFQFNSRGLASGSGGTIRIVNKQNAESRIRVNRTGNSRILREDEE